MNYQVGDTVKVVRTGRPFVVWPFRRFWMPRPGFPYGRARGTGTITEVIVPSQGRGVSNAGGYQVRLDSGAIHYYSEAELRLVKDKKK